MRTKALILTLAVALIGAVAWAAVMSNSAAAQTPTPSPAPTQVVVATPPPINRSVSVTGVGTVTAAPDKATIYIGVRTQGDTSSDALDENSTQMTSLLNTLKAAGIAARDIQTSDFSIYPRYNDSRNSTTQEIIGYEVSNTVVVTIRNLENFGEVLDAAVEAGGNQVNGIEFGFSDPAALTEQAREQAMAAAKANADQLATLADVSLGTVVSINESSYFPTPVYRGAMEQAADAAVPIEAGQSSLSVTVNVTYELIP